MVVVGFNFNKITVERKEGSVSGKINISNNVSIKSVEHKDLSLGKTKQEGLKFTFEFTSRYDPNVGQITLAGEVLYLEEKKKIDEITAKWKKDKKIDQDIMTPVLNMALTRCNIEALILSQSMNLPPPIPLPKIQPTQARDYIG